MIKQKKLLGFLAGIVLLSLPAVTITLHWINSNRNIVNAESFISKIEGVYAVGNKDRKFMVKVKPKIAKEEAIKLADKSLGLSAKGDKIKMTEEPGTSLGVSVKNGIQRLVWTVDFKFIEALPGGEDGAGIPRFMCVLVNAQTGEIFDSVK